MTAFDGWCLLCSQGAERGLGAVYAGSCSSTVNSSQQARHTQTATQEEAWEIPGALKRVPGKRFTAAGGMECTESMVKQVTSKSLADLQADLQSRKDGQRLTRILIAKQRGGALMRVPGKRSTAAGRLRAPKAATW